MTSQHIPLEQLVILASNPGAINNETDRSHLTDCAECASKLAQLKEESGLATSPHETGGSDSTSTTAGPTVSINRVVAELSFDSRQLSPAFGVRSARSVARQLLFSIGENDLDLRVAPDDGAWIVSGQLLGECGTGVVELRGENIVERATMNELCEFYLPRVPPGRYSLLVQMSHLEIEVPEFELRA
jgi:hypothetical protein